MAQRGPLRTGAREPLSGTQLLGIGGVAVALVVLAAAVRYGGAVSETSAAELTRAGAFTKGGLAVAALAKLGAAVITVGWLLVAALYLPAAGRDFAAGRRCLRAASLTALVWVPAVLAETAFSVADLYGVPPDEISGAMLRTFLLDLPQGRASLLVAVAVTVLALAAGSARSAGAAAYLLALALLALLPPLFTGHAAGEADHSLAVYSLAVHVVGAALWTGGLIALVASARPLRDRLPEIVARYSGLALACFAAVGISGLVNAWIRLGGFDVGSRYGVLIVAKTVALAALAGFGWWHRRFSLPALRTGRRGRAFVRVASAEILVMAATMALATGLSRTPPPEVARGTLDAVALRLGFPLPDGGGVRGYVLDWWIDPLFLALIAAGAGLYAAGVARHRRWPVWRTLAWASGLAVVLFATCGGLARYSMVLFSAHLAQHLTLILIAPVLLWLGAPVSLALRVMDGAPGDAGRTPRELLSALVESRLVRAVTRPAPALAAAVTALYGFYFTPLFEASLRNHAVHSLTMLVFLVTGLLPLAAPLGVLRRTVVLTVFHTAFGLWLATSETALAQGWFARLGRTWGPSPLHDQQKAAALTWAAALLALLVLAYRLVRRGRCPSSTSPTEAPSTTSRSASPAPGPTR
ncbi:cytochrome c oxidase assembly protein [Spirillospora sp. CA-294931]|uniref:cytochrome c oxidase assembly protein n=1 Tax=Spirillospora sp. CA-294931 TaxID=3240042 RepID=UPI003D90BBD6